MSNLEEMPLGEDSRDLPIDEVRYFEDTDTLANIIDSELESILENEEYFEPTLQIDEMSLERKVFEENLSKEEKLVSLSDKGNNGNQLPRIQVVVNGQDTLALVDTGASVNFVRPDLLQGIELSNLPHPKKIILGCAHQKNARVLPITLRDKSKWIALTKLMKDNDIYPIKSHNIVDGISIHLASPDAYRKLHKIMQDNKIQHHVYTLKNPGLLLVNAIVANDLAILKVIVLQILHV
ncbi:hypothetical protein JTB14_023259 [Gonioctena quinquepunctata]|nr:hypothetical protein JTB14_023259 [Gonioctena quinquepunctata]